jgi:hypothetical protein
VLASALGFLGDPDIQSSQERQPDMDGVAGRPDLKYEISSHFGLHYRSRYYPEKKMKILTAICIALFFSGYAAAASLEEDVNHYVQVFSGDKSRHSDAVESLAWMGISDARVFDVIERRLLGDAQQGRDDRNEKNRVAHYIRALGFSGQPKYAPTINKFLSDKLFERYAKTALLDLPQYQKWNSVISNRASFDPKYSDEINRVMIMLRSDDFQLKKIGAKRIYFKNTDEVLLDALANEIRTNYTKNDRELSDAIAWMVKALGNVKQPKYRPLLEEVAAKATDSKVMDYAKRALTS